MLDIKQITIEGLKETILSKGYKWFTDQPNIIGIRTKEQIPDVFNDYLCVVFKLEDADYMQIYMYTSEPGVVYQKKLLNSKGCWVMMPAQMLNAYKLGYHQGKSDHKCLRSVGKIFGLREDDKDGIVLNDKDATPFWVDGHLVGANIHGANKKLITKTVGPWSAGCQVIASWENKEDLMAICEEYKDVNNGLVTYTLINENDYIA